MYLDGDPGVLGWASGEDHPRSGDRTEVCILEEQSAGKCACGWSELVELLYISGGFRADAASCTGGAADTVSGRVFDDSVHGAWDACMGAFGEWGDRHFDPYWADGTW